MGSTRADTIRFLLSFVVGLALVPAFVWGIQTLHPDQHEPASSYTPSTEQPQPYERETEPPAPSSAEPQRKPRRERDAEPRRGSMAAAATAGCETDCSTGTIEAVQPVEERRDATDLVGEFLTPIVELPDPRDEVAERLDDVEERLGRINLPDDLPDPTEILEDPESVIPEDVVTAPEIVIELVPPAVEPPAELPDPPAELPETPTALLVLDERTAEELGIAKRTTITLSERIQRALAALSEREGLELSVAEAGASAPPRD